MVGIQAALIEREKTGRGQFVDISLCESAMVLGISALSQGLADSPVVRGAGHLDGGLPNYNIYTTSDGRYLSVGALEPHFWSKFCKFVKAENMIKASADEVKQFIATKTYEEWSALAKACDVCIEPILRVSELASHPQHAARGVFLQHPPGSRLPPQLVLGPRLSNHTPRLLERAAYHGEHNKEIFEEARNNSLSGTTLEASPAYSEVLNRPLQGVRVLDLSRLLPGPLCTHLLVRLGAEVVKVEAPDGDYARFVPPVIK